MQWSALSWKLFIMGFGEQIPRSSPYFMNNLLFLFLLFFFSFNTTLKNMIDKLFQGRKVVWDLTHSHSNTRPDPSAQLLVRGIVGRLAIAFGCPNFSNVSVPQGYFCQVKPVLSGRITIVLRCQGVTESIKNRHQNVFNLGKFSFNPSQRTQLPSGQMCCHNWYSGGFSPLLLTIEVPKGGRTCQDKEEFPLAAEIPLLGRQQRHIPEFCKEDHPPSSHPSSACDENLLLHKAFLM